MKKLIILISLLAISYLGYSQSQSRVFMLVQHTTDAFNVALPNQWLIYCVDSNMWYVTTQAASKTMTLATTTHKSLNYNTSLASDSILAKYCSGCAMVTGWKAVGDTLYIDTSYVNESILDSISNLKWNSSSGKLYQRIQLDTVWLKQNGIIFPNGTYQNTAFVNVPDTTTWLNPVTSFTTPPVSPDSADRYIASVTGGGWTKDYIYEWNTATWTPTPPVAGYVVLVLDSGYSVYYSGTAWIKQATTNYWTLSGVKLYNNSGTSVGINKIPSTTIALDVHGRLRTDDIISTNNYILNPTSGLYYNALAKGRIYVTTAVSGANKWNFTSGTIGAGNTGGEFNFSVDNTSKIKVKDSIELKAPVKINNVYTLPTTDGSPNQIIETNGSGSLSWVDKPESFDSTVCHPKLKIDTIEACSNLVLKGDTIKIDSNLIINGQISIKDGTQGANKVLTSDANGNASWETAAVDWHITGNSGTVAGTNFLGNTDNVSLMFKIRNLKSGLLDSALQETSFGFKAGILNAGIYNSFFGFKSGENTGIGTYNTGIGQYSLRNNTSGNYNTGVGQGACYGNTYGSNNVGVGYSAYGGASGDYNTALGNNTMQYMTSGSQNTAVGYFSINGGNGSYNTALGFWTLKLNSGTYNTALGYGSMQWNEGSSNIGIGTYSLGASYGGSINGSSNIGIGASTLFSCKGNSNIAIGNSAGKYIDTQSNRIFVNYTDRTNILGDTTLSIIYGVQATTTAAQSLYFNSNVITSNGHVDKGIKIVNNANYTLLVSDYIVSDSTGTTNDTLTLPSSPVNGQHYRIKKYDSDAGQVVIKGNGKTIDGNSYVYIITQYAFVELYYVSSRNQWLIY